MIFVGAIEAFDYSGAGGNKRNGLFAVVPAESMCQALSNRAESLPLQRAFQQLSRLEFNRADISEVHRTLCHPQIIVVLHGKPTFR